MSFFSPPERWADVEHDVLKPLQLDQELVKMNWVSSSNVAKSLPSTLWGLRLKSNRNQVWQFRIRSILIIRCAILSFVKLRFDAENWRFPHDSLVVSTCQSYCYQKFVLNKIEEATLVSLRTALLFHALKWGPLTTVVPGYIEQDWIPQTTKYK